MTQPKKFILFLSKNDITLNFQELQAEEWYSGCPWQAAAYTGGAALVSCTPQTTQLLLGLNLQPIQTHKSLYALPHMNNIIPSVSLKLQKQEHGLQLPRRLI